MPPIPPTVPGPRGRSWFSDYQTLRIGFCGLAFLSFGVGWVLLAWLILPLVFLWPGSLPARRRRCQQVVRWAWMLFHDYMRWTGLIQFDPRRQRLALPQPAVIISNHPTLVDVTALLSAIGPACFIAKRPLFRNPLFGPLFRLCGHVCNHAEEGGQVVDAAVARLREGHSVLLFPEGTRSPIGKLDRFRLGAFEIARRAGVPIVPIAISADPPALFKGIPWYAIPRVTVHMTFTPLPPRMVPAAPPEESSLETLKQARDQVRREITKALEASGGAPSSTPGPGYAPAAPLPVVTADFRGGVIR
jgi:1-acyl-sn-glycerol-3-phosphate acyltransferase